MIASTDAPRDGWRGGWLSGAVALVALLMAAAAQAADLDIADFVGRFRGNGTSEMGDRFFVSGQRNLEVEIDKANSGFVITWVTIIQTDNAPPRRRAATLTFAAGPTRGQFVTADRLEPFSDRPAAWAYVKGNTLVVNVMSVSSDGSYELQTYERTLTGRSMKLRFSRLAPGKPTLVVTGQLTRQ